MVRTWILRARLTTATSPRQTDASSRVWNIVAVVICVKLESGHVIEYSLTVVEPRWCLRSRLAFDPRFVYLDRNRDVASFTYEVHIRQPFEELRNMDGLNQASQPTLTENPKALRSLRYQSLPKFVYNPPVLRPSTQNRSKFAVDVLRISLVE